MLVLLSAHAFACAEYTRVVAVADEAAEASRPPSPILPVLRAPQSVNLPRSQPVIPDGLDRLPCTVNVPTNGLQAALKAARGGDVLCLTGTYIGAFTIPPRTDAGWVVVRSAASIPEGRMRPSRATAMARIATSNEATPIMFQSRAARTMLLGLEITTDSTDISGPVALVQVGTGQETSVDQLPTDLVFQQVYVHGWPQQHVRRAFSGNGGAQTLRDSWCDEIHASGFDSQCWISWNASGPILLENNTLMAASENIMFGGADPKVPGLVPSDITIRRNHVTKALAWQGARWNVKNLIETKSSSRVLVEENVIENSWTEGQTGYAFVLKSTTQNSTCAACASSDWTIRRNLVKNTGAGFSIAGRADQDNTGATDSTNRRFDIVENWIGPLNVPPFVGDGRPIIFLAENDDFEVRGNTFEESARVREAVLFDISGARKLSAVKNLTLASNVLPHGQYGVGTSGVGEGLVAWLRGAEGTSTWAANAFVGQAKVTYPAGTTWHATIESALGTAGVNKGVVERGIAGVVVQP